MCFLYQVYQKAWGSLLKIQSPWIHSRSAGSESKEAKNLAFQAFFHFQTFPSIFKYSIILKYTKVWKFPGIKGKNAHPLGASSVVGRIMASKDVVKKCLKEMGIMTTIPASWETRMQVKKQQLESDNGTTDWFQIEKGILQDCILSHICRAHHEKYWAGWNISWNQDCWEKYQ